jgi:hypothetical protein
VQQRRMPTKKVIKKHWQDWLIDQAKFDSIEELYEADYCFACGSLDDKPSDDQNTQYTERAHIKAKTEDGSDLPENLHLLCGPCHKVSEKLHDEQYFTWFHKQNMLSMMVQEVARKNPEIISNIMSGAGVDRESSYWKPEDRG